MRPVVALALFAACSTEDTDEATPSDPQQFDVRMENVSPAGAIATTTGDNLDVMFAPGILIVHDAGFRLYGEGEPILHDAFEALVEEGDNKPILDVLRADPAVAFADSFSALDETYNDSPMAPGDHALLSVDATPGQYLSLASMYGESNDAFVATPPGGLPLFDGAAPLGQDISSSLTLYDAGTELNEEPGIGPNQPARQDAAGDGVAETENVVAIDGVDAQGFSYPLVTEMLQVTIAVPDP